MVSIGTLDRIVPSAVILHGMVRYCIPLSTENTNCTYQGKSSISDTVELVGIGMKNFIYIFVLALS